MGDRAKDQPSFQVLSTIEHLARMLVEKPSQYTTIAASAMSQL